MNTDDCEYKSARKAWRAFHNETDWENRESLLVATQKVEPPKETIVSEEHNAEAIARLIAATDSDDRHHLYTAVALALSAVGQNYQASHFHRLAKVEKDGGQLIVMP